MAKKLKTLLFSTLFPSSVRPVHGIFVETRLRQLLATGQVETKVVAPVPWFPFRSARFGEYAQFAATPRQETRNGIEVHHPRYFLLPKVGMNLAPFWLARGALPTIRRLMEDGFDFDLIDAHYYYPDGVAAMLIAEAIGKPFIVTARGTDLNLIPQYDKPRALILETAAKARASVGVCKALMDELAGLGADPGKLNVWRNGVDLQRFHVVDREIVRQQLNLPKREGRWLISVGHLVERKGHHIAIEALTGLPENTRLIVAGQGPERAALEALAQRLGVTERVIFTGQVANEDLYRWYNAADALVLCSDREGWANVLLEAMACGTPVIATNIWGTPEVVSRPEAGVLMPSRSAAGLQTAYSTLFANLPAREETRRYAECFSWQATSEAQIDLFSKIAVR